MKERTTYKWFTVVALAVIIAPCFAQIKEDSLAMAKKKAVIRKQVTELTKINSNHELIASTTGEWSFVGKHFFPGAPKPFEIKGTANKKTILNGRYFMTETTGGEKMRMLWADGKLEFYNDVIIEAYDNVKQKFILSTFNNETETGITVMEGSYNAETNAITYEVETASHLHGNFEPGSKFYIRCITKFMDKDHFAVERRERVNGEEIVRTEILYTRLK